jgi:fructuronate reductase
MTRSLGNLTLDYDPTELRIGVLHLGVGAFHRGHQAVYLDDLARLGERDWGVVGMNLFPPDRSTDHAASGGLYCVLEGQGEGWNARPIGVERAFLFRPEGGETGLDLLANPDLKLVTLTITEKGYGHRAGTMEMDPDGPVTEDLAHPSDPRTAVGFLVEALRRRRASGLPGLTVMSCDNIPDNGRLLSGVVLDYARRVNPPLAAWIEREVAFPTSMVDRIVPAVDATALALLAEQVGQPDPLGVVTEPFRQWVIEDTFVGPRPPLEKVGATFTKDVAAHEHMKHRILNGAQTALAHLGHLSGFPTTAAVMADPVMAQFARAFMDLQASTLEKPEGESLPGYVDTTVDRLTNPTIHHPLLQIGTDSAFKLRQRITGAVADLMERDGPLDLHSLVVAGWIQYVGGVDARGGAVDVREPGKETFARLRAETEGDAKAQAAAFLKLDVFPPALQTSDDFLGLVAHWLGRLWRSTPRELLAEWGETVALAPEMKRGLA